MGLRGGFEDSREADSLSFSMSEDLIQQFSGERANITNIETRQTVVLLASHGDVVSASTSGSPKQTSGLDSPRKGEGTPETDKTDGSQTNKTSLNNHPSFPNPPSVDAKNPRIDRASGDSSVNRSDEWVLQREIALMGEYRNTETQNPSALAVSNAGEFMFVEHGRLAAHVFYPSGVHRLTLETNTSTLRQTRTRVDTISGFIRDVAFSKANHIILCDCSRFVKIFSKNGKYLCAFITTEVKDSNRGQVRLNCLAVGRQNHVFVGDWNRRCVTVHDAKGVRARLIECMRPARLAVSEDFLIVLPADPMDSIKLLDHGGNTRLALSIPTSLSPWQPVAITCSSQTEAIIVVNRQCGGQRSIQQFALNGDYEGCVTRNLVEPSCVAMTQNHEELVVTDNASIKIFKKC